VRSLREYLQSPQFPDEEPVDPAEAVKSGRSLAGFTGGWVAAGQPRWKAFVIYLASLIGGILLVWPAAGDLDLVAYAGLAFIAFGVFGLVETLRGKRFPRP
jgi:hypothetical protein